jgi:hypothetical protein
MPRAREPTRPIGLYTLFYIKKLYARSSRGRCSVRGRAHCGQCNHTRAYTSTRNSPPICFPYESWPSPQYRHLFALPYRFRACAVLCRPGSPVDGTVPSLVEEGPKAMSAISMRVKARHAGEWGVTWCESFTIVTSKRKTCGGRSRGGKMVAFE